MRWPLPNPVRSIPCSLHLNIYPENARDCLTVYRSQARHNAVWMHPGEPVFDRITESVIDRYGNDGLRGAMFIDPYAEEPYLFHIALVSVERGDTEPAAGATVRAGAMLLDSAACRVAPESGWRY